METIKSFTSLEQAKKLAEILPPESADMCYRVLPGIKEGMPDQYIAIVPEVVFFESDILAWSLAALLSVLPKSGKYEPFIDIRYNRIEYHAVDDEIEDKDYLLCYTDGSSLLDACYEMIIKLNELNLL